MEAKQSTAQLLGVRGVQIGIALFVLQQFAGINAVMYFSTQVFKEVRHAILSLSPTSLAMQT